MPGSRGQMAMAGVHIYAWIRYSDLHVGAAPTRRRAALSAVPLVVGLLGLVPGLVFDGTVRAHLVAPLGLTYRSAVATSFGELTFALQLAAFVFLCGRYALAWRRGVPHSAVHLLALAYLLAMVVNDALVVLGLLQMPYLIDVGFIVPVAVVAYSVSVRFVGDAQGARQPAGSTSSGRSRSGPRRWPPPRRSSTARSSSPGWGGWRPAWPTRSTARWPRWRPTCATSSPRSAPTAPGPPTRKECLDDALGSTERIAAIARQMSDTGRLALRTTAQEPLPLREVALESARQAVARRGGARQVAVEVDAALHGLGERGALVQVLSHLLVNALQAVAERRADGRVAISGEAGGGRVRLVVEDDGVGMEPTVLRRAFEPFFTTRAAGAGMGLGLAAARGLVLGMGGELTLESAPGRGTRATVELPAASPAPDAWISARLP